MAGVPEQDQAATLHRRWLFGFWAWLAVGVSAILWWWVVLHDLVLSDLGCPVPGTDSSYGRRVWSWWPLGARCEFSDGSITDPSLIWIALAGLVALWVVAGFVLLATWKRRSRG